jgi:tetratricopeptide (TPR) repeat protein
VRRLAAALPWQIAEIDIKGGSKLPHSKMTAALLPLLLLFGGASIAQKLSTAAPKPERYGIDVRFEPEKSFLHARAKVTFKPSGPLEYVELELNRYLKLLEVTDEQGRRLEFIRSGQLGSHKLSVKLTHAAPAEKPLVLTFVYEGALPRGPLDYITKDGILLRDESRWYPAADLSALTHNQIQARLPDGWLYFSAQWTDRRASSRSIVAAPKSFWTCREKDAAGEASGARYLVRTCLRAELEPSAEKFSARIFLAKGFLEKIVGPVPQQSFSMLQGFSGQRGAIGYSAPGFLVVSEDVIKYHNVPGWAPEFLPHEIAHQWFPIEVPLARQEDGWLAESLAEYLAWRYLQESDPPNAQLLVQRAMRDALEPEPLRPLSLGLKLFALEGDEVAYRTLYQRGMLVWRTLETVIGRSRVDAALREYYKRFRGRSASVADFRRTCEEISGRDLGWFFEYFLNGTEIPSFTLRRVASASPNEFAGEIVLENVPSEFQARIELRIRTASGVVHHSVATSGPVTPFTVTLPAPALGVTLDPELRLLRWTEAARRNKQQWESLRSAAEEPEGTLATRAALEERVALFTTILERDADNLASNRQRFLFQRARMLFRLQRFSEALQDFDRVLAARSIEPMQAEFLRAWSRVYRARLLRVQGRAAEAAAEARAGLALAAPALDELMSWPEHPGVQSSARRELQKFAAAPAKQPK